jgi:hypothetical protein
MTAVKVCNRGNAAAMAAADTVFFRHVSQDGSSNCTVLRQSRRRAGFFEPDHLVISSFVLFEGGAVNDSHWNGRNHGLVKGVRSATKYTTQYTHDINRRTQKMCTGFSSEIPNFKLYA